MPRKAIPACSSRGFGLIADGRASAGSGRGTGAGECRPPPVFRRGALDGSNGCPVARLARAVRPRELRWEAVRPRARKGIWRAVLEVLPDPDGEWLIRDSTVIRTHSCAAGAKKKADGTGGQADPALGRSRGGFGTKIHAVVKGLGLPVRLILTPGPAADVTQAKPLIEGPPLEVVIADKGYDSPAVVAAIEAQGGEAVVPSRSNAKSPRKTDGARDKDRNLVERFWSKIKHDRRVATRYEKKARNFLAFVPVAALLILLQ